MWPGPYGIGGSRKYLPASLDQSLSRMGLDYVDIFYSHRFDPDTPLEAEGIGCITFSPLAQGMLSDTYLDGIPEGSRASASGSFLRKEMLSEQNLNNIRALNKITQQRGQSLAQMALAWNLRRKEVTAVLVGASSVEQIEENVAALENVHFSAEELTEIDRYAVEGGINLWATSSDAGQESTVKKPAH